MWLNDGLLMSETLVIPIVAIIIGLSARLYNRVSLSLLVLFAVVSGLAVLTRAELIIAIPFLPFDNFKFLKHALEWNVFLGVIIFYLLTHLMWKKTNS